MKYNKKKKLQQGGTLDIKKIMEEARAHQAAYRQSLEQEAIAKEIAAKEAALLDYERNTRVAAPSTHLNVQGPTLGNITQPATTPKNFNSAFAQARKQGLKEFSWNNKRYTTDLATKAPAQNTTTSVAPSTIPLSITRGVSLGSPSTGLIGLNPKYIRSVSFPTVPTPSTTTVEEATPAPRVDTLERFKRGNAHMVDLGPQQQRGRYRRLPLEPQRPLPPPSYPKGTNPYQYFGEGLPAYQQGGKISNDELSVYMAVDYLKAKGISEEDMVGEDGGLKPEYIDMVSEMFSNQPEEILAAYEQDPDGTIQSIIENEQTPEQIEMARKGAKLKKLKNTKMRKCKCGCNLILSKGAGGIIVEKCACGCKTK